MPNRRLSYRAQPRAFTGSFLILLSSGLTGCSIKTPYINARQWPTTKGATYYRDVSPFRVGVLPLVDQRPIHEQHGKRPGGTFLLLWNRRVGDYYTGDHVFGGQVPVALTGQVIEYLQASHVFVEALPVTPSDAFNPAIAEHVSRVGRDAVVDYLLRGEIQHFFGSQSQHTSIYLLPLYFVSTFGWQDSKSLPWGKTSIRFTLYDGRTGDILWGRLEEANHTMPRDTDAMSEAAMESFTTAAGQLTVDLREFSLQQSRQGQ